MWRHLRLRVEGGEHVPRRGPVLIAARHYHHLFDGAALVHGLARQPHLFVALDWTSSPRQRAFMETLCALAEWPVALRSENLDGTGAFSRSEATSYARRSIAFAATLLSRGEVVAVFPEGYPTVDPAGARKANDATILPFRAGLLAIAVRAQRGGNTRVPIVPAGFAYARSGRRHEVVLRLGEAIYFAEGASRERALTDLRARVGRLST